MRMRIRNTAGKVSKKLEEEEEDNDNPRSRMVDKNKSTVVPSSQSEAQLSDPGDKVRSRMKKEG
jgi:hypothetical protein